MPSDPQHWWTDDETDNFFTRHFNQHDRTTVWSVLDMRDVDTEWPWMLLRDGSVDHSFTTLDDLMAHVNRHGIRLHTLEDLGGDL